MINHISLDDTCWIKMIQSDQYIGISDSGQAGLTESSIRLIRDRFQKLIHFLSINDDEIRHYGVQHAMTEDKKKVYDQYITSVSRLCSIARLPNVLLYGADIAGPDLSDSFSEIISDADDRSSFLQKSERNNKLFLQRGRNIVELEKRTVQGHELTIEEVISAYPPDDDYNFSQLCRAGEGHMVIFYDPQLIPGRLKPHTDFKSTLYPLPTIDAIKAVLVAWHKPFEIN